MELAMQIKEETFLKQRGKLLGFIRNRVPDLEEAEDILQDVFYQFISVARNKIIDRYRKKKSQPQRADLESIRNEQEEGPITLQEILPDLGNTPEDQMIRDLIWDAIMDALDELPAEQRSIFIQNELEDRSFREIAEMTGVSINTLLSRKRYAIQALRQKLQTLYNEIINSKQS